MSDNLSIWNALSKPPSEHLKKITGGRISGMTDIKPQWRLQAMTERFGPCGQGWKYEIVKLWTEPGSEGQVAAFALVNLYYRDLNSPVPEPMRRCDLWSDPIPGIGGSMFVEKEKKGPYTSDECYKMAVTDALSVAMKAIGVAADVYLGNWDGSKWCNPSPDQPGDTHITTDELKSIKIAWRNAFPDMAEKAPNLQAKRFVEWASEYAGREFDATKLAQWTRADFDSCVAALKTEEQ